MITNTLDYIKALKSDCHSLFDSPQGKNVMEFLEMICKWYPTIADSQETNDVIYRDSARQVLGTLKTILACSPDELFELFKNI